MAIFNKRGGGSGTPKHRHSDACNGQLSCSTPEHTHGGNCYGSSQTLTCTATSHSHAPSCYSRNCGQ